MRPRGPMKHSSYACCLPSERRRARARAHAPPPPSSVTITITTNSEPLAGAAERQLLSFAPIRDTRGGGGRRGEARAASHFSFSSARRSPPSPPPTHPRLSLTEMSSSCNGACQLARRPARAPPRPLAPAAEDAYSWNLSEYFARHAARARAPSAAARHVLCRAVRGGVCTRPHLSPTQVWRILFSEAGWAHPHYLSSPHYARAWGRAASMDDDDAVQSAD